MSSSHSSGISNLLHVFGKGNEEVALGGSQPHGSTPEVHLLVKGSEYSYEVGE